MTELAAPEATKDRWRELLSLATDFAFETDAFGRFVFVAPDPVLGWPAGSLTGQPAELLLADAGFNPFAAAVTLRHRRVWLRRADGSLRCLCISSVPLLDACGAMTGMRGAGRDVTEQDRPDGTTATALRRGELLDHILWRMRQEVLAPAMMRAALDVLVTTIGADGCAVIDLADGGAGPALRHHVGDLPPDLLPVAAALLQGDSPEPMLGRLPDGRSVVVCPCQTRYEQAGFALWCRPDARGWEADDPVLISSVAGIARIILEHEAIQGKMALTARTDALTGLLNRGAFLHEIGRRIGRLEREELPGTVMVADLDRFRALNELSGHEAGDTALRLVGELLLQTVRPTDLVARLGSDAFAVWLDGADPFAAAERAETLRIETPKTLAHLLPGDRLAMTLSIGIACRWPRRGEDVETLMQQAEQAVQKVKLSGPGRWLVANQE